MAVCIGTKYAKHTVNLQSNAFSALSLQSIDISTFFIFAFVEHSAKKLNNAFCNERVKKILLLLLLLVLLLLLPIHLLLEGQRCRHFNPWR